MTAHAMRVRALAILTLIAVAAVGAVATAMWVTPSAGQTAPLGVQSTPPSAPTTLPTPTTEAPDCTATTNGTDPEAFATRCRGPIVLSVLTARCLGYVGDGYAISYRVTNTGELTTGYVAAQVDDRPPIITEPTVRLERGAFTDTADYPDVSGDGLVVSLVTEDNPGVVSSFPVELPNCPQDPADLAQAKRDKAPNP